MRHRVPVAALLALAAIGCGGTDERAGPERESALRRQSFPDVAPNRPVGEPLEADVALTRPDGGELRLSSLRGRPVVLVFNRGFAGFICPYCTTYTAQLAERTRDLRGLGAEVVVVYPTRAQDEAEVARFRAAVDELLEEDGLPATPFPVYLDRGLAATRRFQLEGELTRPTTFVLDSEGVVRYAYVGSTPDERPSIDRVVEEVRRVVGARPR